MSEAPEGQAGTQLARVTTELDDIARMGMWLAAAESGSRDPQALGMSAALRMAYANRLGLPLHAAQEIHLIKGNLALSAKLCRGLAHQHGLRVERIDSTDTACTAAVVEESTGRELGRTTFTLQQAHRMGLKGDNWTRNPDRMLWARASKRALDDFAPWVTVGVLSVEELEPEPDGALLEPVEILDPDVVPFEYRLMDDPYIVTERGDPRDRVANQREAEADPVTTWQSRAHYWHERCVTAEAALAEANQRLDGMARAPYGEYDAMRVRMEAAERRANDLTDALREIADLATEEDPTDDLLTAHVRAAQNDAAAIARAALERHTRNHNEGN